MWVNWISFVDLTDVLMFACYIKLATHNQLLTGELTCHGNMLTVS